MNLRALIKAMCIDNKIRAVGYKVFVEFPLSGNFPAINSVRGLFVSYVISLFMRVTGTWLLPQRAFLLSFKGFRFLVRNERVEAIEWHHYSTNRSRTRRKYILINGSRDGQYTSSRSLDFCQNSITMLIDPWRIFITQRSRKESRGNVKQSYFGSISEPQSRSRSC